MLTIRMRPAAAGRKDNSGKIREPRAAVLRFNRSTVPGQPPTVTRRSASGVRSARVG
jgi:hypothetical protein